MPSTKMLLLSTFVAVVSIFLAFSPSTSWEEDHFTDEPFVWPASLQYHDVKSAAADGLILKTIVAGPPAAESKGVILFAHGFPETAASWKDYILHFAAMGYHVRAPDLRNVNNSQSATTEMSLDLIAEDFLGVLKSTGQSKAVIIGHDWGSASVWSFAIKYPQHTAALVTMAVPHFELYRAFNVFRLPFSVKHVWYFLFFGLTGPLARWKVEKDDFAWFISWGYGTSNPKTFSKAEVKRLREMYARTMTSDTSSTVTSYYYMGSEWLLKSLLPSQAIGDGFLASMWDDGHNPSQVPTLQLLPGRDSYIDSGMHGFAGNPEYVAHPHSRTVVYDASHWVNHEKQTDLIAEIEAFIAPLK
jgi:pimeloyl-ACP methyl ester carboxylesterase